MVVVSPDKKGRLTVCAPGCYAVTRSAKDPRLTAQEPFHATAVESTPQAEAQKDEPEGEAKRRYDCD
jgi:hypothetical protein